MLDPDPVVVEKALGVASYKRSYASEDVGERAHPEPHSVKHEESVLAEVGATKRDVAGVEGGFR